MSSPAQFPSLSPPVHPFPASELEGCSYPQGGPCVPTIIPFFPSSRKTKSQSLSLMLRPLWSSPGPLAFHHPSLVPPQLQAAQTFLTDQTAACLGPLPLLCLLPGCLSSSTLPPLLLIPPLSCLVPISSIAIGLKDSMTSPPPGSPPLPHRLIPLGYPDVSWALPQPLGLGLSRSHTGLIKILCLPRCPSPPRPQNDSSFWGGQGGACARPDPTLYFQHRFLTSIQTQLSIT